MDLESHKNLIIGKFNVSRETYNILNIYKEAVIEKNTEINLISKTTINNFTERHIIDCMQAIDFIDINSKTCTDIGAGAGLPGLVIAIMLKGKNIDMKLNLYEKSYKKSKFLLQISKKLNLDVEVLNKDIFKEENISSGTIIARAFKPLPILLEIVESKFTDYKNLIVFMGKNGKQLIEESIKNWEFEYKEKKSLTSDDSFLLNIKNIKKK